MIDYLLLGRPNNFISLICAAPKPPTSAGIRRAMDFTREHLDDQPCLADIARHSGMSLRGLEVGLRHQVGTWPGRWLRSERLEKVHAALSAAEPGSTTVTEIALQWRFVHLGDFAAQFRAQSGDNFSDVLAKRG